MSTSTVNRLEDGTLNFTIDTLIGCCKALGVSPLRLFSESKPSLQDAIAVVNDAIESLLPKGKRRHAFEVPPDVQVAFQKHPDFVDAAWDAARLMLRHAPSVNNDNHDGGNHGEERSG